MATNYTGNVTPSLSNAPANAWTDDATKASHVGNTYLVTGSGGTAGNVYAFEEYAAPLVKNASGLPADIVTITDGGENLPMVKAEVSLSPIQDLHGYSYPWAAGAGKNKLAPKTHQDATSRLWLGTDGSTPYYLPLKAGTYTLSASLNVSARFIVRSSTDSVNTNVGSASTAPFGTFVVDADNTYSVWLYTSSGITAADVNWFQLESGSTVTAYAPYENLCPISGHAGATLYRTGKNLFDVESRVVGETNASGTATPNRYTLNDGVVSISASLGTYGRTMMSAQHLRAGTYTLSFEFSLSGTGNCAFSVRDMSANPKVDIVSDTRFYTSPASKTFTLTQDGEIAISILPHNSTAGTLTATNIQLELGSTATSYEPYVGTSYTATFGQTVYGGKFDWVSGDGQSKMASVDLGTLTWTAHSDSIGQYFRTSAEWIKNIAAGEVANMLCEALRTVSLANVEDGCIARSTGASNWLYARYLACADAAAFKTAMSGIHLVYELSSPVVVDLTPTQVQTLLGLNNVWSDGTVEINYSDPFNVENPTQFDALPLFEITNPAANDVLSVNSINVTFTTGYTGTVVIDCETMNAYSGLANMNYLISATDFPVLTEGTNIVTWSGSGTCKMTPRWWEL